MLNMGLSSLKKIRRVQQKHLSCFLIKFYKNQEQNFQNKKTIAKRNFYNFKVRKNHQRIKLEENN